MNTKKRNMSYRYTTSEGEEVRRCVNPIGRRAVLRLTAILLPLGMASCITMGLSTMPDFFPNKEIRYDLAGEAFTLKRPLKIESGASYIEGVHGLPILNANSRGIPDVIPAGTKFTFERMDEVRTDKYGVRGTIITFGTAARKYRVWMTFKNYKVMTRFTEKEEPLTVEYVWGVPGRIHVAPWEPLSTKALRTKSELIEQIKMDPNYAR